MRTKLLTPLRVGAFDLQHRLVLEWPLTTDSLDAAGNPLALPSDLRLPGGLVLYEPGALVWPQLTLPPLGEPNRIASTWSNVIYNAKLSSPQSALARLCEDPSFPAFGPQKDVVALTPRDIEKMIGDYVEAAYRAKSAGFDGIELDGSFGSITDRFLMPSTNSRSDRYGGPIAQRMNFVMELVEGLTQAFGRDRVGVRLSPFPRGFEKGRIDVYNEVLGSLHDQEIAYINLELADQRSVQVLNSSPHARVLRNTYPGIFVASSRQGFHFAVELVENRWADAFCFLDRKADAEFLGQLRRAWLNDNDR